MAWYEHLQCQELCFHASGGQELPDAAFESIEMLPVSYDVIGQSRGQPYGIAASSADQNCTRTQKRTLRNLSWF